MELYVPGLITKSVVGVIVVEYVLPSVQVTVIVILLFADIGFD